MQSTFGIMSRIFLLPNIWLITNEKKSWKTVYNFMSSSNIFNNPKNILSKRSTSLTIIHNDLKIKSFLNLFSLLLSYLFWREYLIFRSNYEVRDRLRHFANTPKNMYIRHTGIQIHDYRNIT